MSTIRPPIDGVKRAAKMAAFIIGGPILLFVIAVVIDGSANE